MTLLVERDWQRQLLLGDAPLSIDDVVAIARRRARLNLSPDAQMRVQSGHEALRELAGEGAAIYGLTTGVGALDAQVIDPAKSGRAQRSLLVSHAAGIGDPLPADVVRAGMLVRINQLCAGVSGIQLGTLLSYAEILNSDFDPVVPRTGSLGAADLCSLAQIALLLVGEGLARRGDHVFTGAELLSELRLAPELAWRDGFALIASSAMSAGFASILVHDSQQVIAMSETATALSAVAQGSLTSSWNEDISQKNPHSGAIASAEHLRALLSGHAPLETSGIREPLSTRSAHRVHGTARQAASDCAASLAIEINAAIDNPCIGVEGGYTNNAANFHAQELSHYLDGLGTALISIAIASERRIARMQLPTEATPAGFLTETTHCGEHSGAMIAHYTAAALVAEMRLLANPASVQSIPVCNGSEDHAPMSWLAASRVETLLKICQKVTAIELWCACRAMSLRQLPCPPLLRETFDAVCGAHLGVDDDTPISSQLARVIALVQS